MALILNVGERLVSKLYCLGTKAVVFHINDT